MKKIVILVFASGAIGSVGLAQSACNDTLACNYDPAATDNVGCLYIGGDCPDGHPATFIDETCTCVSPEDAVFSVGQMVSDCSGNMYHTVVIDDQEWFAENLRAECFSNGDAIAEVIDSAAWVSAGNDSSAARVKYNNSDSLATQYGFLYNGYAMQDERGVCPTGWHVPVTQEFRALVATSDTLDGLVAMVFGNSYESTGAAAALKAQEDWADNSGNNISGISALPSGKRKTNAQFADAGVKSYWWCADGNPDNLITRGCRTMGSSDTLFREDANMKWGCAIRCMRNLTAQVEEVEDSRMSLYPNPSKDEVNIICQGFEGRVGVDILDMQGRSVLTLNGTAPRVKMDVSALPAGTYTVRVYHSKKSITEVLVIAR
ncbi:MAG: FISUMP domain-containing protein [Flavobacteriales bacterium]